MGKQIRESGGTATKRIVAGALVVAAVLVAPGLAFADGPTAAQDAQAEDLFQRAKAEMLKKNYKDACPMFAESYGLAGGGGTLQNLAICYEDEGKLAFAYNRFNELRTMSQKDGRAERVKLAEEHIEKLKPRLSRVRVALADAPPGTKVSVDGDEFGEASWRSGIVVNRGAHKVRVVAPGKKPREVAATVADEGKLVTVDVPALEDDAVATPVNPKVVPPVAPPPEEPSSGMRTPGFVMIGAGAAVAIAGGVFGILTITTESDAKSACAGTGPSFDTNGRCYSDSAEFASANDLHARARTFGTVSTILLPVGVVAAALGTYFVLSSPSDQKRAVSARLAPSLGGLVLSGEFR